MPNNTIVDDRNQNEYEDRPADKLMARVLHGLCAEHDVSRATVRAAFDDLSDTEFDDLWNGDRSVYVADIPKFGRVFEPDGMLIYAKAIFDALAEARG
jgi:hypothetical protein